MTLDLIDYGSFGDPRVLAIAYRTSSRPERVLTFSVTPHDIWPKNEAARRLTARQCRAAHQLICDKLDFERRVAPPRLILDRLEHVA